MSAEASVVEMRPFLYPEAPWLPGEIPAGSLFREATEATDGPPKSPGAEEGSGAPAVFVRFEYPAQPGCDAESWDALEWEGERDGVAEESRGASEESPEKTAAAAFERERAREVEALLADACAKAEERGRLRGREEGLAEGRQLGCEETAAQLRTEVESERHRFAQQTAALFQSFADARDGYVHRLEQEAARLALAIASRILRREAQSDPLLLTGAVRVALGQLAASTVVRLRVPAAELPLWEEAMAHLPNLPIRPEVVGEPHFHPGECRLETELGTADLAVDRQLAALEQSFFDPERELFRREQAPAERIAAEPWEREGAAHER